MAGVAKSYKLPFDYVLYDLSYANLILYGAVLPSYNSKKDKDKDNGAFINADDPRNNQKIEALIKSLEQETP